MRIAIFGTGYIGLVTGTCFAELGNRVTCVDIDENKIRGLEQGIIPIYEPGLEELVKRNHREGRLHFTVDGARAVRENDVIFIAVGTPEASDGSADLQYVFAVARTVGENINAYKVVVDKSTVPVGTSDRVAAEIKKAMKGESHDFSVVSNPEFLREGEAINDFMMPDRVIIGAEDERTKAVMIELYKPVERAGKPIVFTAVKSAELIKYASNAMLASRISFMNELSHLCEAIGGDIKEVAKGMGLDDRIGPRFLQAGVGYGGSCFPKDVQALAMTLHAHGCSSDLVDAVERVNQRQKKSLFPKIHRLLGDNIAGKTVAVMGLAFKPKTDDMRCAPAIEMIRYLHQNGAKIQAFDPVAQEVAKKALADTPVDYRQTPAAALTGADLAVFMTEWNEFRMLDLTQAAALMKQKKIVDGRNIFEPAAMRKAGFDYTSVGREGASATPLQQNLRTVIIRKKNLKTPAHER